MELSFLEIDARDDRPVYRQIAEAIRGALASGRVRAGEKLPPTRDLAKRLGVNRNTVVAAYEALAADGLVRSRTGRGTFLVDPSLPGRDRPASGPDEDWSPSFSRAVEGPLVGGLLTAYRVATATDGISFAGSYPATDLIPADEFARALDAALRERGGALLAYGPTAGHPPLRATIAEEMRRRGSSIAADGVLVTNGSQQAIELVFRTLVDRGDPVVLEDPSYTGALSVLGSLGARLVGVPLDDEGIRADRLAEALERHRPRVIYLQPTFHNPTTRVMSESRRREVLDLASRWGCMVVEDDWAGDLRFEGPDLPTLHAMDSGRRVAYISTFSKKFLPGLRIGWVAAPAPLFERLIALKQIEDCGTSPLLQAGLDRYLKDGGLDGHLGRVRKAYRRRRDAMLEAIDREFPSSVSWSRPEGGLFLWVTLPEGLDGNTVFLAARERGVLVSRGELFRVDGFRCEALRLTYASATEEQIRKGIEVLGGLIRELRPAEGVAADARRPETMPIL